MKPITQEEHDLIMENVKISGKKISHPIELGEISLPRIILLMRKQKQADWKAVGEIVDDYIVNKEGQTDMKCWRELKELKTKLQEVLEDEKN